MFGRSSAWSCVLGFAAATSAAQVSIQVQDKAPRNVATLDPTPVGLSYVLSACESCSYLQNNSRADGITQDLNSSCGRLT